MTEDDFVKMLMTAPKGQLDDSMRALVSKWSKPSGALEVLEVLDKCIHGSLASGIVVAVLQAAYEMACKREGKTHEEVAAGATWRAASS
jgi:hypothetical protein